MWPQITTVVVGISSAVAAVVAAVLVRRGQQEDSRNRAAAEAAKNRIEVHDSQFKQLADLNAILTKAYQDKVAELAQVRAEWEARWSRQMERCRKVTDAAIRSITRLLALLKGNEAAAEIAEDALANIRAHDETDHSQD